MRQLQVSLCSTPIIPPKTYFQTQACISKRFVHNSLPFRQQQKNSCKSLCTVKRYTNSKTTNIFAIKASTHNVNDIHVCLHHPHVTTSCASVAQNLEPPFCTYRYEYCSTRKLPTSILLAVVLWFLATVGE